MKVPTSRSHQHLLLSVFLLLIVLVGVRCHVIVVLTCISLMANNLEHLFMYLCAIHVSSSEKCPFTLISPALQADSLLSEPPGKLHWIVIPKHCMRINWQLGEKTASTVYPLASGNQQSDHTSLYPKNESHKAVFLHRWDFIKIFVSFSLACHQPSPWWS